jgi:hypothetical protein
MEIQNVSCSIEKRFGDHIVGVTPVPIPNTVVKPNGADDTGAICPGKVGRCQSKPQKGPLVHPAGFFCFWALADSSASSRACRCKEAFSADGADFHRLVGRNCLLTAEPSVRISFKSRFWALADSSASSRARRCKEAFPLCQDRWHLREVIRRSHVSKRV